MGKVRDVTLQDIADRLGVSKGLVSLAISGKYGVSEQMRQKILVVAAEMGYKIDKTRYFLKKMKRTALLVSEEELRSRNFWNQVISGIQSFSYKNDIALYSINIDDLEGEILISKILATKASGVIALGDLSNDAIEQLSNNAIPIVLIDSKHYFKSDIDHIRVNNYAGGYEMARYCLERGFTKIAFLGDIAYARSFAERYSGFQSCVKDYGVSGVRFLIGEGDPSCLSLFAKKDLERELQCRPPEIIACVNDASAELVYGILKKFGLEIPGDISVISFDASEVCNMLIPSLTSVGFSKPALGEEACMLLEDRKKRTRDYPVTILLPVSIVERNSVRAKLN